MSSIPSIRRFNWVSNVTAWQSAQAWRERQQSARENFEAANSSASSAFFGAATDFVSGMGDITAKIAVKRIQAERAAKALNTLA
jgi:hypothetical protein